MSTKFNVGALALLMSLVMANHAFAGFFVLTARGARTRWPRQPCSAGAVGEHRRHLFPRVEEFMTQGPSSTFVGTPSSTAVERHTSRGRNGQCAHY